MKLIGMCIVPLIFVCVIMWGGNLVNADEEKETDIGRIGEKATAPEHEYEHVQRPECPSCKEVRLGPEKGRVPAKMGMFCPECKNEISELSVHKCDKCGEEALTCVLCNRASAALEAESVKAECPQCKEVRTRPIKGLSYAKMKMKCEHCNKEPEEWLIEHCDKCDKDFLLCQTCKKVHKSKT